MPEYPEHPLPSRWLPCVRHNLGRLSHRRNPKLVSEGILLNTIVLYLSLERHP